MGTSASLDPDVTSYPDFKAKSPGAHSFCVYMSQYLFGGPGTWRVCQMTEDPAAGSHCSSGLVTWPDEDVLLNTC